MTTRNRLVSILGAACVLVIFGNLHFASLHASESLIISGEREPFGLASAILATSATCQLVASDPVVPIVPPDSFSVENEEQDDAHLANEPRISPLTHGVYRKALQRRCLVPSTLPARYHLRC